jgi:parallel beta-helix repeat protein
MNRMFVLLAVGLTLLLGGVVTGADDGFFVIPSVIRLGTPIKSLPYTITAPGHYFVAGNLTATGSGITVNADNVTLDLMGFTMAGPGSGSNNGIFIHQRRNVEIRNGVVKNFGSNGIQEGYIGGRGHRIINMRVHNNGAFGITLLGNGHTVMNCTATANNYGIVADSSVILQNVASRNKETGILCSRSTVKGNLASNNTKKGFALVDHCLVDQNLALFNSVANYDNVDGTTVFGVNSGI